jgi:hypothetical protein
MSPGPTSGETVPPVEQTTCYACGTAWEWELWQQTWSPENWENLKPEQSIRGEQLVTALKCQQCVQLQRQRKHPLYGTRAGDAGWEDRSLLGTEEDGSTGSGAEELAVHDGRCRATTRRITLRHGSEMLAEDLGTSYSAACKQHPVTEFGVPSSRAVCQREPSCLELGIPPVLYRMVVERAEISLEPASPHHSHQADGFGFLHVPRCYHDTGHPMSADPHYHDTGYPMSADPCYDDTGHPIQIGIQSGDVGTKRQCSLLLEKEASDTKQGTSENGVSNGQNG